MAAEKGVTAGQLALAWVMAQGDDVVPIPGTKRRTYLEENAGAAAVELVRRRPRPARRRSRLPGWPPAAGTPTRPTPTATARSAAHERRPAAGGRSSPRRWRRCCCGGVPSSASAPCSSSRGRPTSRCPPTGPCAGFAELDDELAAGTADVVVTDHHRDELGELLRDALARPARWIGVMGNPRHEGPHVAALAALGVPDGEVARVHRPIGLDIGSRTPAEIAVSTLAGLLADRNGRSGGFAHAG